MNMPQPEQPQQKSVWHRIPSAPLLALLMLVILALTALISGGLVYLWEEQKHGAPVVVHPVSTVTSTPIKKLSDSVLLYSEEISSTSSGDRNYPTIRIMKHVGAAPAEELVRVGKVGEYPMNFLVSPDKNTLAINLETKVQLLDLETKKLTNLVSGASSVQGLVFSPDGKKLLFVDRATIKTATLSTKSIDSITTVDTDISLFPLFWRSDDVVFFERGLGEIGEGKYLDLKTKKLVDAPGKMEYRAFNASGSVAAVVKNTSKDVCNEFFGSTPSEYSIVDPVTGQESWSFGRTGERVYPLGIFSDGTRVLFASEKIPAKYGDCSTVAGRTYYVFSKDEEQGESGDPIGLAREWDLHQVGVTYNVTAKKSEIIVDLGNGATEDLAAGSKTVRVIDQFYK